MAKNKIKKALICPSCKGHQVYHRTKTNDNVCIRCGTTFTNKGAK